MKPTTTRWFQLVGIPMAVHTAKITANMETQRFIGIVKCGDSTYGINHGRGVEVEGIPLLSMLPVNVMIGYPGIQFS